MAFTTLTVPQCAKDDSQNSVPNRPNNVGDTIGLDEYVDLGLRSMTMWKRNNEMNVTDGFFTYDEAIAAFGNNLPTMEQFLELKSSCKWVWFSVGFYKVFGPNKNYIILPAAGFRDCEGEFCYARSYGFYWSSTPDGSTKAWYMNFYSDAVYMYNYNRCYANSVRLVKNEQDN